MAQGGGRNKVTGPPRRKELRKALAKAKKRNAPVKQKNNRRDVKTTKALHKNIERLIAAKAVRNEGSLRIKELHSIGKEQLKLEERGKKKKRKTREDAEALQLKNATKRVSRS